MVSLTATLFKAIINDSDLAAATAEYIIDFAIGRINLYSHADLPLMSGTAESKTVSLESEEYAAVLVAARAIYHGFYKGIENVNLGSMGVSSVDLESNQTVLNEIKTAARQIAELDVGRG